MSCCLGEELVAVGIQVTKGRMVAHLTVFAKHESKVF